jgi:DNA-binding transcriptional regulator GbsR (MarR family)
MNEEVLRDLIQCGQLKPSCRVVGAHMILCPQPQTAVEVTRATGLNRRTVTNALYELLEAGVVGKDHHGLWVGEVR